MLLALPASGFSKNTANASASAPASVLARIDGAPIALLVDSSTGQTLLSRNAQRRFMPASITKVMTLYVSFEMIAQDQIRLAQEFEMTPVIADEWQATGSSMFLKSGEIVSLDQLLRGIAAVSANDAAIVLAQGTLGTTQAWVDQMNDTARALNMADSHFGTPNGWPDEGKTFTTARDLEKLALAMITGHRQKYATYIGLSGFAHNGIAQANHDPITGVIKGADGIKTGFTREAGHGFLGSAQRGDTRLILVLGGMDSEAQRARAARSLMRWGFDGFDRQTLFQASSPIARARVQGGAVKSVAVQAQRPVRVAVPKGYTGDIDIAVQYEGPLKAPINKGEPVAKLKITLDGMEPAFIVLVAREGVEEATPWQRISYAFESWFS